MRRLPWVLSLLLAVACGEAAVPAPEASVDTRQAEEAERVGFPVEVEGALGMRFRLLPTGNFVMGTEEGAHAVHLITPTYLQTREVTNAEYRAFRPDHDSGETSEGLSLDGDDQPVVGVSHGDALAFAAWLRERDPRWLYRLPTEAEWEWACRRGDRAPAWLGVSGGAARTTRPVTEAVPDAWGFGDLFGNVAEWCHDRYGPYPAWKQDNPQGATSGEEFVARGTSYLDDLDDARCARRRHHPSDFAAPTLGFRLAMSLGYARHAYGRHVVTFRTIDPTVEDGEDRLRPGYALRMISVVDRLTDRQNRPSERPIWTDVPGRSPQRVHLAPGRYYVYAHRMHEGRFVRGLEVKFDVPDLTEIDVPVPRVDQESPQ